MILYCTNCGNGRPEVCADCMRRLSEQGQAIFADHNAASEREQRLRDVIRQVAGFLGQIPLGWMRDHDAAAAEDAHVIGTPVWILHTFKGNELNTTAHASKDGALTSAWLTVGSPSDGWTPGLIPGVMKNNEGDGLAWIVADVVHP